jgi:hypothetical protein
VLALPFAGLGFLLEGGFTLYGYAMLLSEFFVALCNSAAAYPNGIAAVTTTIPQVEAVSYFPFLTQVLPSFLRGGLGAWWWRQAGLAWWAPAILVVAAALLLPFATRRLMRAEGGDGPPGP